MSIPAGFEALTRRYSSSPSTALYMEGKSMTGMVRVPSMSKTTPRRRVLVTVSDDMVRGKRRKAFVKESNGI